MQPPFPFELAGSTAFYVVLYLLTFVLHVVFMHYVVAGSLYVLFTAVVPTRAALPRTDQALAATLRDWLPFVLSAAITAGVAPLLFVQVLYRQHFYSANLLLGWRWMLIVPLLVIGFYLLYLLKTRLAVEGAWWLRVLIAAGAVVCFLAIGVSWSVNHLLSIRAEQWPDIYLTRRIPLAASTIGPRIGVWLTGSFATMAAVAGWQLLAKVPARSVTERPQWERDEVRRLTIMAWSSVAAGLFSAVAYVLLVPEVRRAALGPEGLGYSVAVVVGAVLQVIGWWLQRRTRQFHSTGLTFVTVGVLFALLGTTAVRELHRLNLVRVTSDLVASHNRAAQIGGFEIFLIFAVLNIALVGWCVRLVGAHSAGRGG